ncbi:unnamed protein product [Phyllotreta striolata]|uniref:Chaperone DnaJ C-terminal domain-containing protein n=1 Tax=Phyllotreta striolata TaxID=444603 RepID=A0A9N9TPY9_PHYSR|nr:unnamed protein product [Phyllotreta striolata]
MNEMKAHQQNLKTTVKLSLKDALTGCVVDVPTLSGERYRLDHRQAVISPETVSKLTGEGLPYPKEASRRGDLLVRYDVRFPASLPAKVKRALADLLPS